MKTFYGQDHLVHLVNDEVKLPAYDGAQWCLCSGPLHGEFMSAAMPTCLTCIAWAWALQRTKLLDLRGRVKTLFGRTRTFPR